MDREILFINDKALNVLNLKRENVIRKSAEELSLKNDLLRRLIRELVTPSEQKEPLKIYADNKESYFKASYVPIINTEAEKDEPRKLGDVIQGTGFCQDYIYFVHFTRIENSDCGYHDESATIGR